LLLSLTKEETFFVISRLFLLKSRSNILNIHISFSQFLKVGDKIAAVEGEVKGLSLLLSLLPVNLFPFNLFNACFLMFLIFDVYFFLFLYDWQVVHVPAVEVVPVVHEVVLGERVEVVEPAMKMYLSLSLMWKRSKSRSTW
jgi:hypothetical protein